MVRFRTRLVAVTCAVAMVGSFWGSAGAIVSADASEPSAEMAWSITTDKLVFDTGADAKWTDKIYASNDEGTYPELGRIDDVSVGKKAVLTANVTLNGDFSGLDGARLLTERIMRSSFPVRSRLAMDGHTPSLMIIHSLKRKILQMARHRYHLHLMWRIQEL